MANSESAERVCGCCDEVYKTTPCAVLSKDESSPSSDDGVVVHDDTPSEPDKIIPPEFQEAFGVSECHEK